MDRRATHHKRADGSLLTHLQVAARVWNPPKQRSAVRLVSKGGRADAPQSAERLRPLARSILTRWAPEEMVAQAPPWRLVDAWPYGALYALEALWPRLGLGEVIAPALAYRQVDFAVARALWAMVANRAGAPRANLSCDDQWVREDGRLAQTDTLA